MRTRELLLILGVVIALLASHPPAMAATTSSAQTEAADVRREIGEALQAIASYSSEQRDAALATAKEALAKTDVRIEQLQQRIDQEWQGMSETARKEARESLRTLRRQRAEIAEWYGGLKHGSGKAWEDIKKGFSKSYTDLGESLEKARQDY